VPSGPVYEARNQDHLLRGDAIAPPASIATIEVNKSRQSVAPCLTPGCPVLTDQTRCSKYHTKRERSGGDSREEAKG